MGGGSINFGKQKTYRLSGNEDPRIKTSRISPGPGRYGESHADFNLV